jgi:hypothetical protein
MRTFLPVLLLLTLVGAAAVPAAYEAGVNTAWHGKVEPRVRAALVRYRQAPGAMPADSVYWLANRLTATAGTARAHGTLARRMYREAEARGSTRALVGRAAHIMLFQRRITEGRRLLVEAMRRGDQQDAFFFATLPYTATKTLGALPPHPDSLVLFYREVRPLGGEAATRIVVQTLNRIAERADTGDADARRVRADLQARGLWEMP